MKNLQTIVILTMILALIGFSSCKKAAEEVNQFVLTVTKGTGVSGEPSSGSVSYSENATVNYNYSASTGYKNLTVLLDGQVAGTGGIIIMNQNHTLAAECEMINYSGSWKLTYKWTTGNCGVTNGSNENATITHNGDNISIVIPKEGLALVGKIQLDGSFTCACEDKPEKDVVMQYTAEGKMTSETAFTADLTAVGYYKGKKACTSTGTVTGKKS